MLKRTVVLNVVGLTRSMLGNEMPNLTAFAAKGACTSIQPAFPAVTCTAQSSYLTGKPPAHHGIVGNGWYDRDLSEVHFWKQSNHLVTGPKLWEALRGIDSSFTCAQLFWWFNMNASVDFSITPRPLYCADGRKVFDVHTHPFSVRTEIKKELGEFPFFHFWGPAAGIESSRWIANSAKWIEERHSPTLNLVYLPHLDYNLQRFGPEDPRLRLDFQAIDELVGDLITYFQKRSVQVVVLSEYGITPVDQPVHLNRLFRAQGWLAIKDELGLETLDCGASRVFAVADHQVAHVYINDRSLEGKVMTLLRAEPGVELVLNRRSQAEWGINHRRSGDLVAVAGPDSWFTYYYWLDDALAPDFARTVDIHRKIGYDPAELFIDPKIQFPKMAIAMHLFRKNLGLRSLMRIIPLDANLVQGSHGRLPESELDWPLLMLEKPKDVSFPLIPPRAEQVYDILLSYISPSDNQERKVRPSQSARKADLY